MKTSTGREKITLFIFQFLFFLFLFLLKFRNVSGILLFVMTREGQGTGEERVSEAQWRPYNVLGGRRLISRSPAVKEGVAASLLLAPQAHTSGYAPRTFK